MKYVVIYGIISEDHKDVSVNGPFYHGYSTDKEEAENMARELADTTSKNVKIPWVLETSGTIATLIRKARNTWFGRFHKRVKDNARIMARDYENAVCPFQDVDIKQVLKLHSQLL